MQIEIQYWLPAALNFLAHLIVVPITSWLSYKTLSRKIEAIRADLREAREGDLFRP